MRKIRNINRFNSIRIDLNVDYLFMGVYHVKAGFSFRDRLNSFQDF